MGGRLVQPTVKIAAKIVIAINHFEDRNLKKTGRVGPITYYFNFPLIGSFRRVVRLCVYERERAELFSLFPKKTKKKGTLKGSQWRGGGAKQQKKNSSQQRTPTPPTSS